MKTVTVNASTKYDVIIGSGILQSVGERLAALNSPCKVMLVSDDRVFPLYGHAVKSSLENAGFEVFVHVFENGEKSKNLASIEKMLYDMAENKFSRSDIAVALGGGVCGDMTGFAASVFLRGINFVQIPTTLLAAVDSSVGGKTGVDLRVGKNLVGAFHQPILVLCDTNTFKTLPPLCISDGKAEALKYGVICDRDLFYAVKNMSENDTENIVARCVEIKRDIVCGDEFDKGQRQLLNLGHTVGHAIEARSDFSITHGHAVGAGLAIISRAAERLSLTEEKISDEIESALAECKLPTSTDFSADELFEIIKSDKKVGGKKINLIVPKAIGKCEILSTPLTEIKEIISLGM